ncbi:MAG: hypothetical protein O2904_04565 [bacterium]|nr:hypothetical protein [bacterium]
MIPSFSSKYGMFVALIFFSVAAYFLTDFGMKGGGGPVPQSVNLYESYKEATLMTMKHLSWVLVINFCFKIAFDALLVQANGFVPAPMSFWLGTSLSMSIVVAFSTMGWQQIRENVSTDLWVAIAAAIVACVFFMRHTWSH